MVVFIDLVQFILKMWPHPIRAVIFDVDGLLLDSESIFAKGIEDVTGHKVTPDLQVRMLGKTTYDLGCIILDYFGIEGDPMEFMNELNVYLNTILPTAEMMPGAEDLINNLYDMQIPLGLATGSNTENMKAKTQNHIQLFSKIPARTHGNEVSKGKPSPEIFLKSMMKIDPTLRPENVLIFEDSPAGIKGAADAGMASVLVPDPHLDYEKVLNMYDTRPTLILNSLEEFDYKAFSFQN